MKNLTYPIIHTNGTAAIDLYNQYDNARRKTMEAIKAIEEAAPNARDYYPYEDKNESFYYASAENNSRVKALQDVKAELFKMMEHCSKFCY